MTDVMISSSSSSSGVILKRNSQFTITFMKEQKLFYMLLLPTRFVLSHFTKKNHIAYRTLTLVFVLSIKIENSRATFFFFFINGVVVSSFRSIIWGWFLSVSVRQFAFFVSVLQFFLQGVFIVLCLYVCVWMYVGVHGLCFFDSLAYTTRDTRRTFASCSINFSSFVKLIVSSYSFS